MSPVAKNAFIYMSGFMKMVLKSWNPNLQFTKLLGLLQAM